MKSAVSVHLCLVRGRIYIFYVFIFYSWDLPTYKTIVSSLCSVLRFLDLRVELLCFCDLVVVSLVSLTWIGEDHYKHSLSGITGVIGTLFSFLVEWWSNQNVTQVTCDYLYFIILHVAI